MSSSPHRELVFVCLGLYYYLGAQKTLLFLLPMAEEGKVKTDMLFVGLTRVPMLLGVTYKTAMLNALGCMMVYIMSSEIKYMVMAVPIHGFLYYVCSKEPLFLELFLIKNAKCSNARRNKLYHQGNSYDPR